MAAWAVAACAVACSFAVTSARAQSLPSGWYEAGDDAEDEPRATPHEALPPRFLLGMGAGLSVRTEVDDNFRQERLAPVFLDALFGWVSPGKRPTIRFGLSLEVSTNLSWDGASLRGARPFSQWSLAPGFFVRGIPAAWERDRGAPRFYFEVRPSVPWVPSSPRTWGLSTALAFVGMPRASLGVYGEVTAAIYPGGATRDAVFTTHAIVSFELGFRIEMERLR